MSEPCRTDVRATSVHLLAQTRHFEVQFICAEHILVIEADTNAQISCVGWIDTSYSVAVAGDGPAGLTAA